MDCRRVSDWFIRNPEFSMKLKPFLSIGDVLTNAIVIDPQLGKATYENSKFKHALCPFL